MIDALVYGGLVATGIAVTASGVINAKKRPVVCRLAGLEWTQEQMCHNTWVSGAIGAGKSVSVSNMFDQLMRNVRSPKFGGIWADNKGDSHKELLRIAKKHGREDDIVMVEVPFEGQTQYPIQRMNLLTAGNMSPDIIAEILADIATQNETGGKSSDFFRQQVVTHIATGMRFLAQLKMPVTIRNLHSILCDPMRLRDLTTRVEEVDGKKVRVPNEDKLSMHWWTSFLMQPGDQLGGVVSSVENALLPFLLQPVEDVFSSDAYDTVNFGDIEKGKIICIVCPSSFPKQKKSINQFVKSLFFYTGNRRYDQRSFDKREENLLVGFMDEYQKSAAASDAHFLDILRASNCCFIAATQDENSLTPVVGEAMQKVILGKFRNRWIFSSENWASAENSANLFGKRRVWKHSYSSGEKSSSSRSESDEWVLRPEHFRDLPDHYCAILHTAKKIRKRVKLPLV